MYLKTIFINKIFLTQQMKVKVQKQDGSSKKQ